MSQIDVNQVLAQMRVLAAQAQAGTGPVEGAAAQGGGDEFGRVFSESLARVSEAQAQATHLKEAFVRGEPDVDLPSVMVAVQEANISFQAITQVRNRLLSAYQEIMNMPV
ncbi:MAG TPA: flagellar hook-basal body complex protein FliE [Porticoccaceae bacterium]|nr:flagellar hook-basal body complex protein FliE [Porticoccaceae bacterium]